MRLPWMHWLENTIADLNGCIYPPAAEHLRGSGMRLEAQSMAEDEEE